LTDGSDADLGEPRFRGRAHAPHERHGQFVKELEFIIWTDDDHSILDIPSSFRRYPEWQEYLRSRQPRTLVVWGRRDPVFEPAGAEAIRRAVPTADVIYYDTGHFALEEDGAPIAREITRVFAK
jgi:pimeloyl-ACP methyl ester carboxylesterase